MWTLLGPGLRRGAAVVTTVALLALVTGCADDDSSTTGPSSGPVTSGAPTTTDGASPEAGECGAVIPSGVVESLGWDGSRGAVEDRGGCFWSAEEGSILVLRVGEDVDAACARLKDAAPDATYRASVDNPAGYDACGYVRDDGMGQSEIVVVDEQDRVVSIGVAALAPVSSDQVRAALLELTSTVAQLP